MRRLFWRCALALLAAWLLLAAMPALAHDGLPRLELGTNRLRPGDVLEIRGVNVAPEEAVTVALIGPTGDRVIATPIGNEHGDFTALVDLPGDLPAGSYTVRAIGANRVIVSAPLTIIGAAVIEEQEGRDEDDPLLAPMPQAVPALPTPAPIQAPAPVSPAPLRQPLLLVAAALIVAALGIVLFARRRGARAG